MRKPALSSFSIPVTIPHPVEQDEITIPRSLFYLSCSSIFVSFILLIISLLDLGYCSLWLTPPVALFTLIYHAGVLLLSRKKRSIEDPTYFSTVVLCGYLLTILWLVAFILTIVVFASYPHMVEALNHHGLHTATVGLQQFQCFLCITDLALVGGFTARSHSIAMLEGDPEHWRVLVESQNQPVTREIRIQRPVITVSESPNEFQEPRAVPATPPVTANLHAQTWVSASEHEQENYVPNDRISLPLPPFPESHIPAPPPPEADEMYDDYYSDYYGPERRNTRRTTRGTTRGQDSDPDFDPAELYRQITPRNLDLEPHRQPQAKHYSVGDSLYEEPESPESPETWDEVEEYYLEKDSKQK